MTIFTLLTILLSVFIGAVLIIIMSNAISNIVEGQRQFLNDCVNLTPSQLKGDSMRMHRYTLIKQLDGMKKIFTWVVIGLLLVAGVVLVLFFMDNREYFKKRFEVAKYKIELQSEEKVDSLLINMSKMDSINNQLKLFTDSLKLNNIKLEEKTIQLEKSNRNLNNVIRQQNVMIEKLAKEKQ